MKNRLLLFGLLLLMALSGLGQKHEVGVDGGFLFGNPVGKANNDNLKGGGKGGVYYRYVLNKWIGVQGGLDYQNFVEDGEYLDKEMALRHSLTVPVRAVVFPRSRFSILGGLYMRKLFGDTKKTCHIYGSGWEETQDGSSLFDKMRVRLGNRPVWGYEAGVAWNHKSWRLVVSFRQDFTSWMLKDEHEIIYRKYDYAFAGRFPQKLPKSTTCHLTVEVPLWRAKK